MIRIQPLTTFAACLALATPLWAEIRPSSAGEVEVTEVASGFDAAWAVGFLPDGGVLVTERIGTLYHLSRDGQRQTVTGGPEVAAVGQGGLLDVLIPRDFAETRQVYLTYAKPQGGGEGTALGVGELSEVGSTLRDFRTLWEMTPGSAGGRHFGSRIVEGADGYLYVTVGDRGDRPSAQDLSRENGSVLRLTRDGRPAPANPFFERPNARPQIWSYGHRNPQGAALDASGQLWTVEHGARGGDEVNLTREGANYGWPVIAYGRHYSGGQIGEGTEKAGMEQPAFYWDPSMAPSGMMIYSGKLFLEWEGDIFIGSLKFDYVSRLEVEGETAEEVEQLAWPETLRVRDVREAPDGSIWFISEGRGAIYRVAPVE